MFAIHLVYGFKFSSPADVKALWEADEVLKERYLCYRSKFDGTYYIVKRCDHVGVLEVSLRDLVHNHEHWLREVHSDDVLRTFLRDKARVQGQPQLDIFLIDKASLV